MKVVYFAGNLGADAETVNANGKEFVSFSVAVKLSKEDTEWVRVSTSQTSLAPYLKKGTLVSVVGTESVQVYTDKSGQAKAQSKVSALRIQLLGGGQSSTPSTVSAPTSPSRGSNDDDLPF